PPRKRRLRHFRTTDPHGPTRIGGFTGAGPSTHSGRPGRVRVGPCGSVVHSNGRRRFAAIGRARLSAPFVQFVVQLGGRSPYCGFMTRRPVPFEIGPVHFIGIGGIGMSGIAEIMMRTGYQVQGSDAKASANTERLEKLGAKIFVGHDAAHIEGAYAVVYSTAVKADNPEMAAAREKHLPL